MFDTNTLWFDIALVSHFFLFGHIYLGHFEERSPKWRKVAKYLLTQALTILISTLAGQIYVFIALGVMTIPVLYIHGVLLPKKGINGWTGEPKSKYYEFRGWSKDIFND